ncbi:HAMP domain-containing histidine kinase [Allorhizobium sp. BGMRC 0089]|uniref:HAMP domain-containing sensor histidine kinase n=1 Tax=Allorhizobium sonneratiae TaxID=2934936 RepID=UPI002034A147|nr:HAMP domain-containing sensor histidine kinase [Allorhizobium sonneratiae]MCM2293237.1 HAMP domain-containing histidine kinase [Allorhizobium sonneratiae]
MPRLFWKFFLITWLTMTLSTVVGVTAITVARKIAPPEGEMEKSWKTIRLLLSDTLQKEGPAAVQSLLTRIDNTAERTGPSHITLESFETNCSVISRSHDQSLIQYGNACYRITTLSYSVFKKRYIYIHFMPWITAIIAGLCSAYVLTRYLLTPVLTLRKGLRALAAGQFDVRIHDTLQKRNDEIALLTQDFDLTAGRLQQLQQSRQRLFHDISHELRSPLSRLQAVTGILQKHPQRLPDLLDRIEREIIRLDRLVGEILTLARLSTNEDHQATQWQTLDLIDLLDDIVQDAAFEGHGKDVVIAYQRQGHFVSLVNGELIYRAIENVIRNAVKYTRPGSTVRIETMVRPHSLEIAVSDEGDGVAAADLEAIFNPFTYSGNSTSSSGYGLGLAITKSAVERHGGTVRAENRATGGLTVTLTLPRDHLQ